MPAGRQRCPWHTLEVIPTTLAPKTGEVSWVSMGLRRVLFLAEVSMFPSKSLDSSSGLEVVDLEVKFCGVSPTVLRRVGSRIDPAGGHHAAASWRPASRNLNRFGL
jgi:hypothetical protein